MTAVLPGSSKVRLVIPADFDDLIMDLLGGAPPGQNVLGAHEFDRLGDHGGGAEVHKAVAEVADGGIGAEAAGRVAAAALNAHHQAGDVAGFPLDQRGVRHHLPGRADGLFNGPDGAALFLNAVGDDGLVGDLLDALPQLLVRDILAAQADDPHSVDVGVGGKADQNFLRHLLVALDLCAAGVVDHVDGAVYLGGNDAAGLAGAGAGGQNQHVIADTHGAVRALVTHKVHSQFSLFPYSLSSLE